MSTREPGKCYRIVLRGRLGERSAPAFEGMTLFPRKGETVLEGRLSDQSQLFGLLDRIRDLAIELVRVEELRP
jgi:hypothetical protein